MIRLDERGNQCPVPVIHAKNALQSAKAGEQIVVITDNEIAVQNLHKLADQKRCGFEYTQKDETTFESVITVNQPIAPNSALQPTDSCCAVGNTVVAIGADSMGSGDDQLGEILIKGFLFAITQLEELPSTILFYNGGAYFTCEGSEALEDLRNLQKEGVKIITCGTCLNHYGLADRLVVGEVGNMYTIVETMHNAGKVIRP